MLACQDEKEITPQHELSKTSTLDTRSSELTHAESAFKARFYTKRDYSETGDGFCTEDPFLNFNYQVGGGNGTHLGKFDIVISFCGNDGFDYKNGEGTFTAANGDELYVLIPSEGVIGHILPIVHPKYELFFETPFELNGGTGRFEGVTGNGITESYVDLFDDEGNFILEHQTDHVWTGTIVH